MFTRDELLMLAMVTGNRAQDVARILQSKDYSKLPENARREDEQYEADLLRLSERCHKMIEDGEFRQTHTREPNNLG